jgi:nitrogen fixation protein FixH
MNEARVERRGGVRGIHVLAIFVGFFLTVAAVDGFFIYQAVSTFGGIETPDAYKKGVAYNASIARDVQQARLGWQDEVAILGAPRRLRVALRDRDGTAIAGKRLAATIGRPATDRFDAALEMYETSAGIYEAPLPATADGTWIVDLSAYEGEAGEPAYQARRRLWIGP